IAPGEELVVRQGIFAGQQTEFRWGYDRGPEAQLGANGAVATQGALREVDPGGETDGATMTAAMISFHDFPEHCCISSLKFQQIR
ncbi:MAG TPA: hypothetical protein VF663_12655, partial [Telluria sp.]